jgi:hypothetical protein
MCDLNANELTEPKTVKQEWRITGQPYKGDVKNGSDKERENAKGLLQFYSCGPEP